jgi:hypothetical protein
MNIQIANYHISDKSRIEGTGKVSIVPARQDTAHGGTFKATVKVGFDPTVNEYPAGSVKFTVDLSDSFKGTAASTNIEQINTHGKHTPTAIITGRCKVTPETPTTPEALQGCRFWILIANNKRDENEQGGTPDIVSFIIFDRAGKRIAYGTGPVESGNFDVSASGL